MKSINYYISEKLDVKNIKLNTKNINYKTSLELPDAVIKFPITLLIDGKEVNIIGYTQTSYKDDLILWRFYDDKHNQVSMLEQFELLAIFQEKREKYVYKDGNYVKIKLI